MREEVFASWPKWPQVSPLTACGLVHKNVFIYGGLEHAFTNTKLLLFLIRYQLSKCICRCIFGHSLFSTIGRSKVIDI